jgi:hypothetical protein
VLVGLVGASSELVGPRMSGWSAVLCRVPDGLLS